MPELNWTVLAPALIVAGTALVVLCIDILRPVNRGLVAAWVAVAGTVAALIVSIML